MNKIQKIILTIFIPILILVISYGIADRVLDHYEKSYYSGSSFFRNIDAFDFEDTWWIWGIGIFFIMGILFMIYRDKNKKK